jgi:Holliday junction resolvasome RuvABC endonuclease subunit
MSRFRFSSQFRRLAAPAVSLPPALKSIGMDFGARNTAFCVMEHNPYRLVHVQMVPVHLLIDSFREKDCQGAVHAFTCYIESILIEHKPDIFIGELFFSRGARNQNAGLCMFMLALTAAACRQRGVNFVPVNSGAWKGKGWLQKIMTVQELYALKIKKYAHMIDAVMLALYADKTTITKLGRSGFTALIRTAVQIPERRQAKPKPERKTLRTRKVR